MDKAAEELIEKTITYWIGKKDNPLNGKTFNEIEHLAETFGPKLEGYIA